MDINNLLVDLEKSKTQRRFWKTAALPVSTKAKNGR